MASLSEKLKSLGVEIGGSNLQPPEDKQSPTNLVDILPGKWHATPHGETFIVDVRYPQTYKHGKANIQKPATVKHISRWLDAPELDSLPMEGYAFIDTETTGLTGGAGVYTFLVGVGRFVGDHFQIRQFFMQDPAEETAQLYALESFLAGTEVLVSYNGKAFDLPRLSSRFATHHWPAPLRDIPHIDLLHLARRLWKDHLSSCTLGDIEYYILDFERTDEDVPGWEIADLFFEYLQSGDPSPLKRVFYHNEMDVLSMAAVLDHICLTLDDPEPDRLFQPAEAYSIGKFFADIDDTERAISLLEETIHHRELSAEFHYKGIKTLSFLHKKAGDFQRAIPLWEEAAGEGKVYAHIELAKYYEHQEKAYQEAIHWTLEALSQIDAHSRPTEEGDSLQNALDHRLQRLKRKAQAA